MNTKEHHTRPTIGFLCERLIEEWTAGMWKGVCDAAQEHGVNLICFSGSTLYDPRRANAQANLVYDLASAQTLDGLLLWGAQLAYHTTVEELTAFCERYRPLPIVNIGLELEGVPSLLVDNHKGMYDVVNHLIEAHGYRRIVYICGPGRTQEARDRYFGYADALTEHGISLDPALVVTGDEMDELYRANIDTGEIGVRILLDERKLKPGVDFEAVVGRNDGTCWFALKELQARGIRVPADVAMVGFDDLEESRYQTPPLTAARQSFYDQGWRGVEMLLAQLRGEKVPERVILPIEIIVRQSCGCGDVVVKAAGRVVGDRPDRAVSREELPVALGGERERVVAEMAREVGDSEEISRWVERVLDSFIAAITAGREAAAVCLQVLEEVLRQVKAAGGDLASWHGALSAMRAHLASYLGDDELLRAENLWQQARVLMGEMARREQAYELFKAARQNRTLQDIGTALTTTFDVDGLMDALVEGLPRLGIPGVYFSLYEDPEKPVEWSRLMLAYGEEGRVELDADGVRFPSTQLVPEGLWPQERRYSFLVSPLYAQYNHLGFVLCEIGPREGTVYETLRVQISNALQGALLMRRVRERSAELARQQYILDTFMETIPDRVYFKNLESRITRANKAHANKLGLSSPSTEIGKSDFDFFPEEQAQVKYEQEQEIIRTGEPLLNVEEVDDEGHWALTTKMPLRDENGEIIGTFGISRDITAMKEAQAALEKAYAEVEQQVAERTAELEREQAESLRLQQEVIEAQQRALQELSTPIIPVLEGVIVMPLIGSIDTLRARDITRSLLTGIREHRARVVILDITGVPIVDSGVAAYLNKTIQAARLKGARAIITGVSEAVAETIVDLGIDWSGIETMGDLQTGLRAALGMSRALRGRTD